MLSVFAQVDIPDIQWLPLIPHMVMAGSAVVLLTIVSLAGQRLPDWFPSAWTVATGLAVLATAIPVWLRLGDEHLSLSDFSTAAGAIGVDRFSVFVNMLLACTVVLTALIADGFLRREKLDSPAFYVLLMLSAAGGMTMASANDLIVLFLGLEILSLAVYVLVAMHLRRAESQEAGIKYFVLGAFASAFLLYGIALIYGATGSVNLADMGEGLSGFFTTPEAALSPESGLPSLADSGVDEGLFYAGMAMLLVGFGFKVAAVPFHAWTPDVYQGAPSPVVSYMAAGVKAAGFAALLRVFVGGFARVTEDWRPAVFGLAVASLAVGSVLAIVQTDVKRVLAYSSISHAGFILVGVQAAFAEGARSVMFYLAAYAAMAVGSFAVVTVVSDPGDEGTTIDSLRGLAARRPVLAGAFTVLLLSQAGIPFTVGFWAKFEVLSAAIDARSYWLAVIAMLAAVVAAFLYLRIVVSMYLESPDPDAPRLRIPPGPAVAIGIVVLFTVAFGVYPEPLTDLAKHAVPIIVSVGS